MKSQWYDKARQQMSQSYEKARQQLQEKNNMMSQIGLSSISSGLSMLKFDVNEIDIERDIENEILKEGFSNLTTAMKELNEKFSISNSQLEAQTSELIKTNTKMDVVNQ